MSSSLSCQCFRSIGRTLPWSYPAKKARIGRCDTLLPPMLLRGLLGFLMVVSGRDTSFPALNIPSDTSALHRTLMVFCISSSCSFRVYGPCKWRKILRVRENKYEINETQADKYANRRWDNKTNTIQIFLNHKTTNELPTLTHRSLFLIPQWLLTMLSLDLLPLHESKSLTGET